MVNGVESMIVFGGTSSEEYLVFDRDVFAVDACAGPTAELPVVYVEITFNSVVFVGRIKSFTFKNGQVFLQFLGRMLYGIFASCIDLVENGLCDIPGKAEENERCVAGVSSEFQCKRSVNGDVMIVYGKLVVDVKLGFLVCDSVLDFVILCESCITVYGAKASLQGKETGKVVSIEKIYAKVSVPVAVFFEIAQTLVLGSSSDKGKTEVVGDRGDAVSDGVLGAVVFGNTLFLSHGLESIDVASLGGVDTVCRTGCRCVCNYWCCLGGGASQDKCLLAGFRVQDGGINCSCLGCRLC